ncbi:MAG: hypothetical protein JNM44_11955 [Chitinophagaceae bacterium]|nr:hypothetical protein [Chitinophagaceae bacterium]
MKPKPEKESKNRILQPEDIREMLHGIFLFWIEGRDSVRCPFPEAIHQELQQTAEKKCVDWYIHLPEQIKKDLDDELIAEQLEEKLFEIALNLVQDPDEKISIKYPLMPRVGDEVRSADNPGGQIIERRIVVKEQQSWLEVSMREIDGTKEWSTQFELFE